MKTLIPLKWAGLGLGVLVAAFAAAQSVRPELADLQTDSSLTIQAHFAGSSELGSVLDRACGECHSNTMSSRWYTQWAPFSWVIARAARDGRQAVNFSAWAEYSPEQRSALLLASCADAKNGTMPVPAYVRFWTDAKLSAHDVATICDAANPNPSNPAGH